MLEVYAADGSLKTENDPISHDEDSHDNRLRTFWIPAQGLQAITSTLTSAGTEPDNIAYQEFSASVGNVAVTTFSLPTDFIAGGSIQVELVYMPSNTNTGDVRWTLVGVVLDPAVSAVTDTDVSTVHVATQLGVTNGLTRELFSAFMSVTDTDSVVKLGVQRNGANAADTATGTSRLLGIKIGYLADM